MLRFVFALLITCLGGCSAQYNHSADIAKYYNNGQLAYDEAHFSEAVEDFTRVLDFDSSHMEAIYHRGLALWLQGDNKAAMVDFNTLLQIYPDYAKGYSMRGSVLLSQYQIDAAIDDLNYAIKLDDKFVYSWVNRCTANIMAGNLTTAMADCNQALSLDPENPFAFESRAINYYLNGTMGLALNDTLRAVEYAPAWSQPLFVAGSIFADIHQPEQAAMYFDKAFGLDPFIITNFSTVAEAPGVAAGVKQLHEKMIRNANKYLGRGVPHG